VLDISSKDVSFGLICQIKPALKLVENLRGVEKSAFTDMVDTFLNAAKRKAAEKRPVVQKAGTLPGDILKEMYKKVMGSYVEGEKKSVDPVHLRTLVRCTVVYFTFCRFSCFQQLQAKDFEDRGDCIRIVFKGAKNDQMHNGTESFLVKNEVLDPVQLVRDYFNICGFKFGAEQGDKSFLNSVIVKGKNDTWNMLGKKAVSYGQATGKLRKLMSEMGYQSDKITDKSFKMLGVTRTLEEGVSLDEVMNHGRWRTLSIPLHYKVNSVQYKQSVASKVPI